MPAMTHNNLMHTLSAEYKISSVTLYLSKLRREALVRIGYNRFFDQT